jgi:hypothetical protein
MWARIYLTPLLQAEEDRDQVRRYYADQAREKALFGSTSSPYNSDRYGISSLRCSGALEAKFLLSYEDGSADGVALHLDS